MAQLHNPGFLSTPFPLFKGTRQGCPLSLLLFDLALEPLARYLEDTNLYQVIRIGKEQVKLALYADYVILFLGDPLSHLPDIFCLISQLGTFLGYKINVTKS